MKMVTTVYTKSGREYQGEDTVPDKDIPAMKKSLQQLLVTGGTFTIETDSEFVLIAVQEIESITMVFSGQA